MKSIFVYNPLSGSAVKKSELRKLLQQHDIKIDIWLPINKSFNERLKKEIKTSRLVYVFGGDGTISSVASLLTHSSSILVPLPGGTLNHFTKDLGVPQNLADALDALHAANDIAIDIASVNETYFINNSSIGLYAHTLEARDELESKLSKWPAALIANVQELIRFRRYHLTIDGKQLRSPLVFVGNNRYTFELGRLGSRTSLNKKELTFVVSKALSRFGTIRAALRALLGGNSKQSELLVTYPAEVIIEMRRKNVTVSHDGEKSRFMTPLRYQVHGGALTVRLPITNTSQSSVKKL